MEGTKSIEDEGGESGRGDGKGGLARRMYGEEDRTMLLVVRRREKEEQVNVRRRRRRRGMLPAMQPLYAVELQCILQDTGGSDDGNSPGPRPGPGQ